MKNDIALIIIYNHRFDENIEKLENIYGKRFSNIYHLVPFYNGEKENVIPVYENSHYFHGYIAQGLTTYFDESYSHYLFVADDLMLNPAIDDSNFRDIFKIDDNTSFITGLITLHQRKEFWSRIPEAFRFSPNQPGLEATAEIPTYAEAYERFNKFGLTLEPLDFNQIYPKRSFRIDILSSYKASRGYFIYLLRKLLSKVRKEPYHLSYPLVGSYSDIFVIPKKDIRKVCHLCGIFAAMDLFVELALPTAVVLTSDGIVQEKDLRHQGKALWEKEEFDELDKYEKKLSKLLAHFPEDYLYYHPIKLSGWDADL